MGTLIDRECVELFEDMLREAGAEVEDVELLCEVSAWDWLLAECKQTGKPGPCPDPSKKRKKKNRKRARPDVDQVATGIVGDWEAEIGVDREKLSATLASMTVKSIGELKKKIGVRAGGRKAEMIEKLVNKVEKIGQQQTARFKKIAQANGVSWDRVQAFSSMERSSFNDHVELSNGILKEARQLYQHFNFDKTGPADQSLKRLDRGLKVFRDGGDHTMLPHWDQVAESLALKYPEVFGDETPEEVLFDMVAGGPQKRMNRVESYKLAMESLGPDEVELDWRGEDSDDIDWSRADFDPDEPIPF